MIFRSLAACVIAICLSATAAMALEPAMILSYGSNDCARFLRAPRLEKQMYLSWTEGFISAANLRDAGTSRMAGIFWNQAANTAWLQTYCTQNPQSGFILVADALRMARGARKSR
jgi:hypothetical protein